MLILIYPFSYAESSGNAVINRFSLNPKIPTKIRSALCSLVNSRTCLHTPMVLGGVLRLITGEWQYQCLLNCDPNNACRLQCGLRVMLLKFDD